MIFGDHGQVALVQTLPLMIRAHQRTQALPNRRLQPGLGRNSPQVRFVSVHMNDPVLPIEMSYRLFLVYPLMATVFNSPISRTLLSMHPSRLIAIPLCLVMTVCIFSPILFQAIKTLVFVQAAVVWIFVEIQFQVEEGLTTLTSRR